LGKKSRRVSRNARHSRSRTVEITPELCDLPERQKTRFTEKFGRPIRPNHPVFFDPDEDTPQEITEDEFNRIFIKAAVKAGVDPAYIHAFKKTGLLVTTDNWDKLSSEMQEE
jgi:integrase